MTKEEIGDGLRLLANYQRALLLARNGSLIGFADNVSALQNWMLDHAETLLASALKAASLTLPFTSGYQAGLRRAQQLAKEHVQSYSGHGGELNFDEFDAAIEQELSK